MFRLLTVSALATSLVLTATAVAAQGKRDAAPGQDRVCLITFKNQAAVEGGANVDVVRAKILPRKAAEAQEGGEAKIFTYGAETAATCECLNNPSTRATC
jgi:hypothetical protein